jgi:hypothetical protein
MYTNLLLNILAPVALATYLAVKRINKYNMEWSPAIMIAYILGSLCLLTIIVNIVVMYNIIQKTRQHLKDVGFRREVLDPNVLRNAYFLAAALGFVLIAIAIGLVARLKYQGSS